MCRADGGDKSGSVVVAGTPEQIAATEASHTGHYLRDVLARAAEPRGPVKRRGAAATGSA